MNTIETKWSGLLQEHVIRTKIFFYNIVSTL
jgi:hypothetical protein